MAKIPLQPFPKIPPIGFFEPIKTDVNDMMTDVEYLLAILKKLNECILQLNKNSEFIDEYTGKIEEIEAEIVALRNDYLEFTNTVTEEIQNFENDINNSIALQFAQIKLELQSMIATALTQANAYTDSIATQLRAEIEAVSIGDITLFDPSTGAYENIQDVINNIWNSGRDDALTATEYDTLDNGDPLSATAYDAYQLSAFDYDKYGKTMLV